MVILKCSFMLLLVLVLTASCIASDESKENKNLRVVVAEVVKVVGDDTINVIVANTNEKLKVRLYGIDAP